MRYVNSFLYDKPSILLPRKASLTNIQFCDVPFWTVDTTYYTVVNDTLANFLCFSLRSTNIFKDLDLYNKTLHPYLPLGRYGCKSLYTYHIIQDTRSVVSRLLRCGIQNRGGRMNGTRYAYTVSCIWNRKLHPLCTSHPQL